MARRRMSERFDEAWPRAARAVGLLLAVGEWLVASYTTRPLDPSIIAFAGALVALPSVLARRDEET